MRYLANFNILNHRRCGNNEPSRRMVVKQFFALWQAFVFLPDPIIRKRPRSGVTRRLDSIWSWTPMTIAVLSSGTFITSRHWTSDKRSLCVSRCSAKRSCVAVKHDFYPSLIAMTPTTLILLKESFSAFYCSARCARLRTKHGKR